MLGDTLLGASVVICKISKDNGSPCAHIFTVYNG
jgi:hypothetical protein